MKNSMLIIKKYGTMALLITGISVIISCSGQGANDTQKAPDMTIHEAVFFGDNKALKQHIAADSDLNVRDQYGSTPLSIAATFNKTEAALALIDGGADLNAKSGDGSTPLHTAAFFGRVKIVERLLEKGASTTVRNNYGSTALESITSPFEDVKPIYDQLSRDLGPMGFKLDYDQLKNDRPVIAELIKNTK